MDVALYMLNHKRDALTRLEQRYAMAVYVAGNSSLLPPVMHMETMERREAPELESVVVEEPVDRRERPAERPERADRASSAGRGAPETNRQRRQRRRGARVGRRRPRVRTRRAAVGAAAAVAAVAVASSRAVRCPD